MIVVEVQKAGAESNANLLRRFSKRVQSLGLIKRVRGNRFADRAKSDLKKKADALKRLNKQAAWSRAWKLGKIRDVVRRK
jgi:ribosomal protein S21